MALIVDRWSAADTDDDAVQVVDLDDIVTSRIDGRPSSADRDRRRRVTPGRVIGLALAFVVGLALSVPIVAVVRQLQGEDDDAEVDIRDGHLPLPAELDPPVRNDEPPPDRLDPSPDADADPDGKAAVKTLKEAAAAAPPTATAPTASSTTMVPAASPGAAPTAPPTTAPSTTATPTTASTTTSTVLPDPGGPDYSVPG